MHHLVGCPELESLTARTRWDKSRIAISSIEMPLADKAGPVSFCSQQVRNRVL